MAKSGRDDQRRTTPATSFQILRRLVFDHGRRYGIAYLAALVFMGVGSAATALVAYLLKPVLNHMVEQDGLRNMRVLSGAVAMLFAVRGVCSYFSQVLLARMARITANMQLRLFDRLLDQDIAWLRDGHSSAMLARLAIATGSIRDIPGGGAVGRARRHDAVLPDRRHVRCRTRRWL